MRNQLAVENLTAADERLSLHLGPKHPLRLQLKELIEKLSVDICRDPHCPCGGSGEHP